MWIDASPLRKGKLLTSGQVKAPLLSALSTTNIHEEGEREGGMGGLSRSLSLLLSQFASLTRQGINQCVHSGRSHTHVNITDETSEVSPSCYQASEQSSSLKQRIPNT